MDEPDFESLLNWVEGRLDAKEAAEVERYLDDPEHTQARQTVAWIRALHESRAEMMFPEPPHALRGRLNTLFSGRQRDQADRFLAGLLDEHTLASAAPATRAVGQHAPNQLAYLSPALDVIFEITRTGSEYVRVEGQLLPKDGPAAGFEIRAGSDIAVRTREFGEFALESVNISVRAIRISWVGGTLNIPVDLREQA